MIYHYWPFKLHFVKIIRLFIFLTIILHNKLVDYALIRVLEDTYDARICMHVHNYIVARV